MIMNITASNLKKNSRKLKCRNHLRKPKQLKKPLPRMIVSPEKIRNRKGLKDFWGKFKDGIIDLFKEEEDHKL